MPKTTKKKSVKSVSAVRRSAKSVKPAKMMAMPKSMMMPMADNKLVVAALVLLLAVAIFMLVEAWMGVR